MKFLLHLFFIFLSLPVLCQENWTRDFPIHSPRENLYQLEAETFYKTVMAGRVHTLFYPVSTSELTIPYWPLITFFESKPDDRVRAWVFKLTKAVSPFKNMQEVFSWLGLHDFPITVQPQAPNPLPTLTAREKALPMGATLFHTADGDALTFGCAACHTADLFGVKVLGLTNRFPRANEFFHIGARLAPYVNTFIFKKLLNTTEGEREILERAKHNLQFVGVKVPAALGLDTSLAQVALSLARRENDEYATPTELSHRFPRRNKLETMVADSKPSVWWNLKYKNRWLSDGSIVSGNPVHTNLLWNEIGRGADLKKLEIWLQENEQLVEELTAAAFASKPPRYEAFFGEESINIKKAQRGKIHYVQSCQRCHGTYEKGWENSNPGLLTKSQLLQNTKVTYHIKTPVRDVGTDPGRYLGMKEFAADLNRLTISKTIGAVVEPQTGYVPPPLDGIWARWPYFHNNSIPNLCALLTVSQKRPLTYVSGAAINKSTDFDQNCVGYPLGKRAPMAWKENPEHTYDTRKEGLSNKGHDVGIFIKDGKEIYTRKEKLELIEFLKTL